MRTAVAVEAPAAEHLAPFLARCPACSEPVLIVELADRSDVALEPREVLPRHVCPACEHVRVMGHQRQGLCSRCRGTGYLGEPLPDVGAVRVDAAGVGRPYRRRRSGGDAIHRLHVCGPGAR